MAVTSTPETLAPALEYAQGFWPRLIRHNPRQQGTLIGLPRPYLVPADGDMFQEMYYWDSFFMALGLVGTEHEDLILAMADNLAYLFRQFGVIPNGSRYYFLSRSQPPFFTQLIWLAWDVLLRRSEAEARRYLASMMRLAEREHETVWMGTAQPHHRQVFGGLSRYFDINFLDMLASCESGWDHSTRCDDLWLQHLPVDLNSILYVREMDFARAAEVFGNKRRAAAWRERARERGTAINRLMWDEERGYYFDFNWAEGRRNRHLSLAGFYPLWAGLASQEQADRVVREWLPQFEHPGGLVTTEREQAGRQWAYPNGWAPLQWLAVGGLERYGYTTEAQRIMSKWCANCAAVFDATGTMWEKYNVVRTGANPEVGLYGSLAGFGWSNGVFVDFARRLRAAT
ncbi:MAG TPA: trehalase family glycosidase [Chloroflexota bacterium]